LTAFAACGGTTTVAPSSVPDAGVFLDGGSVAPNDAAATTGGTTGATTGGGTTGATTGGGTTGATTGATTGGGTTAGGTTGSGGTTAGSTTGSGGTTGGTTGGGSDGGVSMCAPSPAPFAANTFGVVADADYVYTFYNTGIARIPKSGGAPELVIDLVHIGFADGDSLMVDDQYVYWRWNYRVGMSNGTEIDRAPKVPGGTQTDIFNGPFIDSCVMNGDHIFYNTDGSQDVGAIAKDGSGKRVVSTAAHQMVALIAADADYVYWTSFALGASGLERAPVGGGAATRIAVWNSSNPTGLVGKGVADDAAVYLFDYGSIRRVLKSDPQLATLFAGSPGTSLQGLALDGTNLYWATTDGTHNHYWLLRGGKDGTGLATLVDSAGFDFGLAVTGDSVYFSEPQMMRICK
jgi:hypothetical protein